MWQERNPLKSTKKEKKKTYDESENKNTKQIEEKVKDKDNKCDSEMTFPAVYTTVLRRVHLHSATQ